MEQVLEEWQRGNYERARELWQVARKEFEAVIEERPDDHRAYSALGRALARLGNNRLETEVGTGFVGEAVVGVAKLLTFRT